MKKFKYLLSIAFSLVFTLGMLAQNSPGYRYASAQYEIVDVNPANCIPGDPTVNTFTVKFNFKFEVDASAMVTYIGGSQLLSALTPSDLPFSLPGAISVNFGAGSGGDNLNAHVNEVKNGVGYLTAEATRIYRRCEISSNFVDVYFVDGPRTSLPLVGLSGDTDPGTNFDNRNANLVLNLRIPVSDIEILENYESPISDVGNFTRRAIDRTNSTIQLQATTDESVSLDSYQISPTTISGLFNGGFLEEAGITNLSVDPASGLISFSTVGATAGRYPLQIIAFDDRGGATTNDFMVELIPPCNSIPTFVASGTSDNSSQFNLDPDQVAPFTLNVEVASGTVPAGGVLVETSALPTGASFTQVGTSNSYIFSWNPDITDPNVELTVYATDIDINGNKLCESAEIKFNLRIDRVDCIDPAVSANSVIYNVDQPAILPTSVTDITKYYDGISTGVDASAAVSGRNSTFSYVWEILGTGLPTLAGPTTQIAQDVFIPVGYDVLRVTITDENLDNCSYTVDKPIARGVITPVCVDVCPTGGGGGCIQNGDPNTTNTPTSKYQSYEFFFSDGTSAIGTSTSNTILVTSTTAPDFNMHISCSDDFSTGYGTKDGPYAANGVSVTSYNIWKYNFDKDGNRECKSSCGTSTTTTTSSPCGVDANAGGSGDYKSYEFYFSDAPTVAVTGTSTSNTVSVTTSTGITFNVHVSCSDAFPGGYGAKDGPQVSDGVQVVSYKMWKYKSGSLDKCCDGTPSSTSTPSGGNGCIASNDPNQNASYTQKYQSYYLLFSDGSEEIGTSKKHDTQVTLDDGTVLKIHIHAKDGFPNGFSPKKSKHKYPDPRQASGHPSIVEYAIWEYDFDKKKKTCKGLKKFSHSGGTCVSQTFANILVGSGEYTLGACTNKTSVYSGPTGIGEGDFSLSAELSVYPNPSSGLVTLEYEIVDESPVSITVYDLMGRIVFSNNFGMQLEGEYDEQLDLSSLNSGLYMVNVELNGSVETTKIQIVK